MKIKMYANYGINGLKYPLIAATPAEINDPVWVTIPDEWKHYKNELGQTVIVLPDGTKNLLSEIQTRPNGKVFFYGDKCGDHCREYPVTTEKMSD